MGFTFDDTNPDATPISEMRRLVARDPRNQERILPFIGGEELNQSPKQEFYRYAIDFDDLTEPEARSWPDLMDIVETKVKPIRLPLKRASLVKRWWQYAERRPGLRSAIKGLDRLLAVSEIGQYCSFAFLPNRMIYAHTLVIFALPKYSSFAILQSRVHQSWALFFGSSMKDDLRYTPSDCFEAFPLPMGWENDGPAERIGESYYEFRADLMVRKNEGLTKTYTRFHDPGERDPEICRLRELHAAMDRAVLDAYGWTDLKPTCEFILDYEEEEPEDGASRKRKKPWRYRWPDDFRDEVLARLLALNQERAEQEKLAALPERHKVKNVSKRKTASAERGFESLFK